MTTMDEKSFTKLLFSCLVALILLTIFVWSSSFVSIQTAIQPYSCLSRRSSHIDNDSSAARPCVRRNAIDTSSNETLPKPTKKKARILCWIMTGNKSENVVKVSAVTRTWAPRFDKFLIVKEGYEFKEDAHLLTVPLAREGRDMLWNKVVAAFTHIYRHHLTDFDWFMKADDDTYVFVDALERFLANKSARQPIYFGHKFKPYVKQGYMSGGSGYVLSREALRRFIEQGVMAKRPACVPTTGPPEDVQIGKCLADIGVESGDSRDSLGRPTFHPLNPEYLLSTNEQDLPFWYFSYNYYNVSLGKDCCSTNPISFHYVSPKEMILLDWLTYNVKPERNRLGLT